MHCNLASHHASSPETILLITKFNVGEDLFLAFNSTGDSSLYPSACKMLLIAHFDPPTFTTTSHWLLYSFNLWFPSSSSSPFHTLQTPHALSAHSAHSIFTPSVSIRTHQNHCPTLTYIVMSYPGVNPSKYSWLLLSYAYIAHLTRKEMYSWLHLL